MDYSPKWQKKRLSGPASANGQRRSADQKLTFRYLFALGRTRARWWLFWSRPLSDPEICKFGSKKRQTEFQAPAGPGDVQQPAQRHVAGQSSADQHNAR